MTNYSDLVVVLDLLLIDKFEDGDRLEVKLGNSVFSIGSNEIHEHFHDFCGSPVFKDRRVRRSFLSKESTSELVVSIQLIKGN